MNQPTNHYDDPPIPTNSPDLEADLTDSDTIIDEAKPVEQDEPIPKGPEPIDVPDFVANDK